MATTQFGGKPPPRPQRPFKANYSSVCTACGEIMDEGELIRSDGDEGWEHADHADENDG